MKMIKLVTTQVAKTKMRTTATITKKEHTRQKMDKCTMDIMMNRAIGLIQVVARLMIKVSIKDIGMIMDNGLTQAVKLKITTKVMIPNLTIT
jgi:hypothetical protein